MSNSWELMAKTDRPATRESIRRDLVKLGLREGDTVIVHSSLKALGYVVGASVAVVGAMLDTVGDEGTIVTPSHSYGHSDPSTWTSPPVKPKWVDTVREHLPAFDPQTTPTTRMGRIVETFRSWPGTLRSRHPETSFCANGKNAEFITANHSYEMGQGNESPLARIYDLDGKILLIGVGYDRNTSFHLAEYRIDETPRNSSMTLVEENGKRAFRETAQIDGMDDAWLRSLGESLEQSRQISIGKIGQAESRLFSQREAVDYAQTWLRRKWSTERK
jgi:aminoglycoside 3-N-acetyltransferase